MQGPALCNSENSPDRHCGLEAQQHFVSEERLRLVLFSTVFVQDKFLSSLFLKFMAKSGYLFSI